MEPVEPLCVLTTLQQQFEAEHLQQVLQSAGINAFIEGLHCSSNFAFNTLVATISIKVPERDLQRAQQVLREARQPRGSGWYCGPCAEFMDAGFDICWRCGRLRSEVESDPPPAESIAEKPVANVSDFTTAHATERAYDPNPYATPRSDVALPIAPVSVGYLDQEAATELEETIDRAWRASVIGLIALPVVAHAYSMLLLLGALSIHAHFTQRSRFRYFAAMAIDLAVLGYCVIAFAYFALRRFV